MKRVLCGAVVVGATFLAGASACWADEQPTKTTTTTTKPESVPAPKTEVTTTTTAPTTQTRTRGMRARRGGQDYQRSGRFSTFVQNLRGRFGR